MVETEVSRSTVRFKTWFSDFKPSHCIYSYNLIKIHFYNHTFVWLFPLKSFRLLKIREIPFSNKGTDEYKKTLYEFLDYITSVQIWSMYSETSLKSASKRVLARVPINHERVADVSNYISLATNSTSLSLYLSRTYLVVTSHSKRNKLLTTKTKHQSLSHTRRLIMELSECRGKIRPSYNKSASKGNPHSTSTS